MVGNDCKTTKQQNNKTTKQQNKQNKAIHILRPTQNKAIHILNSGCPGLEKRTESLVNANYPEFFGGTNSGRNIPF
jgi:hypothetical protein